MLSLDKCKGDGLILWCRESDVVLILRSSVTLASAAIYRSSILNASLRRRCRGRSFIFARCCSPFRFSNVCSLALESKEPADLYLLE